MHTLIWLCVLLAVCTAAALELPPTSIEDDGSPSRLYELRRQLAAANPSSNDDDAVDDDDDQGTNPDVNEGDDADDANTKAVRAGAPVDQSKMVKRRRPTTSAEAHAALRKSNPTLYDGLAAWAVKAPTLNLTDPSSAHEFMTQFVTLQGQSVTWLPDKLPALLPYMRLLLPSAALPCTQACAPKMMENVIRPVSAIVAQRQGKWGVWFFLEAHKLLLNIKQHVPYTVHGCGRQMLACTHEPLRLTLQSPLVSRGD